MPKALDIILVGEVEDGVPRILLQPGHEFLARPLRMLGGAARGDLPHIPQLAPVALGTYLRGRGYEVLVVDNVLRVPSARRRFLEALDLGPAAVGISTTFMMSEGSVRRIAGSVRERAPRARIILGGESSARNPGVRRFGDVTVLGQGERTLELLLEALRRGAGWEGIPNLVYGPVEREVRTPREDNMSVADAPPPDWGLLAERASASCVVEASRGCRYDCSFCCQTGRGRQDMKSAAALVAELRRDCEVFGAREARFVDPNFTSWPQRAEESCRAIREAGLPLQWSCYARPDDFARRPTLGRAMAGAGCDWVFMGVESGSDEILRRMRKGCGAEEMRRGMRLAREAGLKVHASFIIGFPGETRRTVEETLGLIEDARPETVFLGVLCVPAGTDARIVLRRADYGLSGEGLEWRHATMDSEEALRLAAWALDRVCLGMEDTLPATGTYAIHLAGKGLTADDSLAYLKAFRDFYRAEKRGDAPAVERSLSLLRGYRERVSVRMDRF